MKTVVDKFRDMPLKQKLFACIVALIILPLVISLFIINNYFTNKSIQGSLAANLQNLKQTDKSFESLAYEVENLSIRILSDDTIQDLLSGYYENNSSYDESIIKINLWLQNELYFNQNIAYLTIYAKNDTFKARQTPISDIELDGDFKRKIISLNGKGIWSDSYQIYMFGRNEKSYAIAYCRGINDRNSLNRNLALEVLVLEEDKIYQMYSGLNSYKGSEMYLIGNNGKVISSTNKEMIGKEYIDESFEESLKLNKEGYIYNTGKENITFYHTVSKTGWKLVQTIPRKSFIPFADTINILVFIAIFFCLIFGILFSVVQSKVVLNPLKYLLNEMQKLRSGNFNIEFITKSNDEVGQITKEFTEIIKHLQEMINLVYISKVKQREAELIALEAQINPHFLYNTLDSIHWLAVKEKKYTISEQIEALSEMFRHVLHNGSEIVTIQEELEFLKNYIFLQKAKYGNRIEYVIHVDPELNDCITPKLILQPLVENSVLHGLEPKLRGGTVEVSVMQHSKGIRLTVSDNGVGTDGDKINSIIDEKKESHNIFALSNINERIKMRYGENYGLSFFSEKERGTRVEVLIPMIKREG